MTSRTSCAGCSSVSDEAAVLMSQWLSHPPMGLYLGTGCSPKQVLKEPVGRCKTTTQFLSH